MRVAAKARTSWAWSARPGNVRRQYIAGAVGSMTVSSMNTSRRRRRDRPGRPSGYSPAHTGSPSFHRQ
jgi:hypothetical protein